MSQELSQHKACEEPKLFIQVLGKDHPEGHRFFFYDEHDEQEQPGLTDAVEEEDLPEPISRVHSWKWEAEPNRNVWLEIASEEGNPIRVPLFAGVSQTPWQEHERDTVFQQYVVQPIVPLAFWQSLIDDASHALPSRNGYLYIHYRGALWREIEVSGSEADEWQFKDIDLAKYRDESEGFVDDRRLATGQSLTEIWLPARRAMSWLNNEVKVAFSDVQWSAARLNCLETDPAEINHRFQSVSLQSPSERIESGQLLAAEQLVPQRARTPCLELQIVHPPLWVEDLSGSAVSSLYQQALSEQESFDRGGSDAVNGAWNEANRDASPLKREVGLRAAAADMVCQSYRRSSISTQPEEGSEPPNWEELPDGGDVLEDARQRRIPGLIINDPLFELRHALSQMQLSQNHLSILLERCAAQPHYRSAIMVQKRIMPENIGGESNPLRSLASNQALKYLGGVFHTSVATLARDVAHQLWEFHQAQLAELIGNSTYQRALVDYFSLEESDYLSGFCLVEQCFTALSLDPKRADILANEDAPTQLHTANNGTAQRTLLALLEEGSTAPLHAMCFPDSETHPVDQPFALPEEESNDGTGRFRAKALADESNRGDPPDTESLQTLEISLLAAAARLNTIGELNRWSGAMDNVFGRIAESGKSVLSQVAEQGERTAMAARIYMPAFNASRGALHNLLGDLTFQPLGDVDMSRVALLGVEDTLSGMTFGLDSADRTYIARNNHRQFYGEVYRTSNGEL
ncbi:toxin VasX, partial [Halomonas sp. AOP30-A1-24]